MTEPIFFDDFDAPELDRGKWLARYLPHWTRGGRDRPRYSIADSCLTLRIDPDQPPWCPEFDGAVKVSNLQTGHWSGPVGSREGQHRFAPSLVVREAHPAQRLFLMQHGRLELRAKADIGANHLAALWLIGYEDAPQRCGELCVAEIKGWERRDGSTLLGYGIKPFADPALRPGFHEDRLLYDLAEFHVYAIDWQPDGIDFFLDGQRLTRVAQSPAYPLQLMLNLYELPNLPASPRAAPPTFSIDSITVWPSRAATGAAS